LFLLLGILIALARLVRLVLGVIIVGQCGPQTQGGTITR
jgi:hypothetical protein